MFNKIVNILFGVIIICMAEEAYGQNYVYRGNQKYPAAPTWEFKVNGTTWANGDILYVTVAKFGLGAYLMLQNETVPDSYIGGNIIIFLENGDVITCTDKNIKDRVNNKSVVLYIMTKDEVDKLKKSRISTIRFTIKPTSDPVFNGAKTADNKKEAYSGSSGQNSYETETDIIALFKD